MNRGLSAKNIQSYGSGIQADFDQKPPSVSEKQTIESRNFEKSQTVPRNVVSLRASHENIKRSDMSAYRTKKSKTDTLIEKKALYKKKKSIVTVDNNAVSKECYSMKAEVQKMQFERNNKKSVLSSFKVYGSEQNLNHDDSQMLLHNNGYSALSERVDKIKSISASNLRKHIPQNI